MPRQNANCSGKLKDAVHIHSITHIFGRSGIERGVGSNSSGQFFSFLRVLKSPELGIVFELTSILSRGIGQFIRTTLKAVV
jgi:hypothetical protein